MRAIEVTINVLPDGVIQLMDHPDLPPGTHHALLVVEEPGQRQMDLRPRPPLELTMLDWSAWPADSTFRREDLYGNTHTN